MGKVFVNIGLSLDGYMAPEGMTMGKPEYKNWGAKWGAMMAWILNTEYLGREMGCADGHDPQPPHTCAMRVSEGGRGRVSVR